MRAFAAALVLFATAGAAPAAEINAFISTAIKAATDELLPPFERRTATPSGPSYAPSGALVPRFERGEPVDVFLTDSTAIDALISRGKIVAGRIDLARTGIGIAVKKGAPKPDVSSPEALRRALLAAKAVGHAAPAGGSITAAHIMRMFETLGIAAEITPKVKLAAGGPQGRVSVLVSSGEAEIGLQQVSELLSNPGRRGDRHAAGGAAAHDGLFRRRHGERPAGRRRAGADQGPDRTVCGADLEGQRVGSGMMGVFS